MQVVFDPDKGVVEVRGENPSEHWPFVLDCTAGVARIDLGGATLEVRPLTWRQKRLLARYSGLGASFVQLQFLQLTAGGGRIPDGGTDQQVLRTLAMWINAPDDGGATVPHPSFLARVEADVCRSLLLRPGDLDQREALDVEATWRSLSQNGGQETESALLPQPVPTLSRQTAFSSGGPVQRIRVLPDPQPVAPSAPDSDMHTEPVHQTFSAPPSLASPVHAEAEPPVEPVTEQPVAAQTSSAPDSPEAPAVMRPHLLGERPFRWSAPAVKNGVRSSKRNPQNARTVSEAIGPAPIESSPLEPAIFSPTPARDFPVLRAPATPANPASQPVVMSSAVIEIQPPPVPVPLEAAPSPAAPNIDIDAIFDELSDRLEQAAAELGIEVGV